MSLRRKIFYGLTLSVLAVLLVLPATGWLARMQLFPILPQYAEVKSMARPSGTLATDQSMADFIAAHPHDFDMQFAYAMTADSTESLKRLKALDQKFPDNAVVVAARLVRMTMGKVHLRRPEEYLLSPVSKRPTEPVAPEALSDPAAVAEFVALAEQGERLAPNNAFFPCMAAVGNFARHQDDAAVTAWIRAGSKPEWDDYSLYEVNAKWKLQTARNHGVEVGFLPRTVTSAAILFPQYAPIRGAARMVTVKAFQAELAGNAENGFALRAATRHLGTTMMSKNSTFIGVLVGRAIAGIAGNRPGGAEPQAYRSSNPEEENRALQERRENYQSYLTGIGHPEEAAAFAATARDGDALRKICSAGLKRTYMGFGDNTFRLLACWYGDILLLTGVVTSLTFAGLFKLIYKFSPRLQQGDTLQASVRWGIALGFGMPALIGLGVLSTTSYWAENHLDITAPSSIVCGVVYVATVLLLVVPPLMCRLGARGIGHGLLVMMATVGALAAVGAAGAATWYLFSGPIAATSLIQGLTASDPDGETTTKNMWSIVLPAVISGVMLSFPLVMLGLFALFSRILRIPVGAGVTRGMRATAIPLACVLLLGWSVCLVATVKHENAALAELKRLGQVGEPQMLTELMGKTYPDMTDARRLP